MSASALLAQLKEAGVTVEAEGGNLRLKGPKAALGNEVLTELRAIKAKLIAILSPTEPGFVAEWRAAAAQVEPDRPHIERLRDASLRFLDSKNVVLAIKSGWDAVSLFGLHKGAAPKERLDCWGLAVFVAWGVHRCKVEKINEKVCTLRSQSGALQMLPRSRANLDQAAQEPLEDMKNYWHTQFHVCHVNISYPKKGVCEAIDISNCLALNSSIWT